MLTLVQSTRTVELNSTPALNISIPAGARASTHRGKWGQLTTLEKMDEKLKSENMQKRAVFYVITARCYASAVLAMGLCPSMSVSVCVCLSVCLSVTSRCSTKTAKRRITQTTPHDIPGTLVFWCQRSPRNSTGVTPYEGAECRWGGSKSVTFDQ